MLKKYLNYSNLLKVFLNFSFVCILSYLIALTLFLSMPPKELYDFEIFLRAKIILESVICSLTFTIIFGLIIKYETYIKTQK